MKKFNIFPFICLIALFLSSCAATGGGVNGSERFGYSSGSRDLAPQKSNATRSADQVDTNSEFGFYLGVTFTDLSISEDFDFQPSVNFVSIKNLNQIQAPLLVSYMFAESFSVQAGPNVGFLLDAPDGLKSFNFGADLGLTYDVSEKVMIQTRYNLGLANLLENGDSGNFVKLNHLSFGLGYKIK